MLYTIIVARHHVASPGATRRPVLDGARRPSGDRSFRLTALRGGAAFPEGRLVPAHTHLTCLPNAGGELARGDCGRGRNGGDDARPANRQTPLPLDVRRRRDPWQARDPR